MRISLVGLTSMLLALTLSGCGGGGDGGGGDVTGPPQTGSISGAVTAANAGVQGAQVSLSGGGAQTTDASGQFRFPQVPAGNQTLTLTSPAGFELDAGQTASKSVTVAAGQTATVNWSLRRTGQLPRNVDVRLEVSTFDPSSVTIGVGGTVRWVNATATPHTITPNNTAQQGAWPDQNISGNGTTFSHTFSVAGTYDYHCKLHAGMSGTVRVQQ